MARHKHRWQPRTVVTHTAPIQVNVLWRCAIRGCRTTRTVHLQVRRPAPGALTDAERGQRDASRIARADERRRQRDPPVTLLPIPR